MLKANECMYRMIVQIYQLCDSFITNVQDARVHSEHVRVKDVTS
jgi:hypothetical protein